MSEKTRARKEPGEPLITLLAAPCELPALKAATVGYIRLLEISVPPSQERAEVMRTLHSLLGRYQEAWGTLQALREQKTDQELLIPVQMTDCELIAFASAMLGYIRLLKLTVQPCELRTEIINHLLAFEKRYLDSIPPPVPLCD